MTLFEHIIREYCKKMQIFTMSDFRSRLGIPHATASGLWHATRPPRSAALRKKLFEATRHPVFAGTLTLANKRELFAPFTGAANLDDQVQRTAHLLLAIRIDLRELLAAEDATLREALRRELAQATNDPDAIGTITTCMRALQSERTLQTLRAEGQLKGGTRDHSH